MSWFGPGVFASDSARKVANDLSSIVGINLVLAGGEYPDDWKWNDPPVLTLDQSAEWLGWGHFKLVFDFLRSESYYYQLVIFVLLSMRVGAKVGKKYRKYIKKKYKKISQWEDVPEARAQIRAALKESRAGQPYKLREFDLEDSEEVNSYASSESEKEEHPCRVLMKTSIECCPNCKTERENRKALKEIEHEPTAKRARIAESAEEDD